MKRNPQSGRGTSCECYANKPAELVMIMQKEGYASDQLWGEKLFLRLVVHLSFLLKRCAVCSSVSL